MTENSSRRASVKIEDYALIGDRRSAALVSRRGAIDWLCLPRFDSDACFAALLGGPEHGTWTLAPSDSVESTTRAYRKGTLILETRHKTGSGSVVVVDFMRPVDGAPTLVRLVRGERGAVAMRMHLALRFGYGSVVPWVRKTASGIEAIAGPDRVEVTSSVEMLGEDLTTVAEFVVREGETVPFALTWSPSHEPRRPAPNAEEALSLTEEHWTKWSSSFTMEGPYSEVVHRSLLTLKALTYAPTGGIVAAPTTSLPEQISGSRNWDYRFCWLRDATFTLYSLMNAGYTDEAVAWREWLLRAVAGEASKLQTLYGLAGERRHPEYELEWLPGYEGSAPVRVGNAASGQLQIDVWGEVMDALYLARRMSLKDAADSWPLEQNLLEHLVTLWRQPDEGIWEVRGPRRHFTHSKVMAWVAFDRAIRSTEEYGLSGPVERWRQARAELHTSVCEHGWSKARGTFVQHYDGDAVDSSLLMIALVGFLPARDPRVVSTVQAIERDLMRNGFVERYSPLPELDGQVGTEGVFLPCSFWLVDNYVLQGRWSDANALFERLIGLANDVGLLSEEYDPLKHRLLGNFPQAFSHVSLINSARNLASSAGPAQHRGGVGAR
jgi:GH15 family glucan-1,4-alpha-glucosidase